MKLEIGRDSLICVPQNEQDEAFIEDTLKLQHEGEYIELRRVGAGQRFNLVATPSQQEYTVIYICHPYSENPEANRMAVRDICREIMRRRNDVVIVAPQLYFGDIVTDEMQQQDHIIEMCCELICICDEVHWYKGRSPGCDREIEYAESIGKPVVNMWEVDAAKS